MAMLMTGRVLLVCALCVLWCGAGGGDAWDFNNDSLNEYYYGAYGVYCNASLNATFCEEKRNASKREKAPSQADDDSRRDNGSGQPNAGGSSGGQEQTSEKNGSDQSGGATGTQLQKPGEGGTETPTPTVTAAHSADGQDNSSEESHLGQPEGTAGEGTQASQPPGEGGTETPTPATVTAAQTSATRTPDESDGSTAASHTTSPLFLFLLACAAAAAVVAA
ncbi:Mucin-associated surface protein (MASP) [Trypanosoma cruzi]|uniref:Mucin-associated surface protein (MASP), putative n=2 Tax=Trypanosoma cruzi TaxID=5693 RepID=Q4E2D3_TRYCC|nr:mucin-associated surface protein (MASP), putative [Trypanosoma cruzi]EAN98948.1 mucin-associated surface protein (MASP), putative [Trypanosoma cruzi]PWV07848.1 Mucin-associated surface protein (MASP) [Trypanosoma cruzi]|eukprot:XP_820799.1 mucin-associated surface protein (MASP) [Trypanosoma cruzi strain CL Brener]